MVIILFYLFSYLIIKYMLENNQISLTYIDILSILLVL